MNVIIYVISVNNLYAFYILRDKKLFDINKHKYNLLLRYYIYYIYYIYLTFNVMFT